MSAHPFGSGPIAEDPVLEFEHDHVRFSQLVSEVRERIHTSRRTDTSLARSGPLPVLERLRDDLSLHFACEEEGLFPYLVAHIPGMHASVDRLVASHERICRALTRMVHIAQMAPAELAAQMPALGFLFARFESAYGEHAREELVLLRAVGPQLDERQRSELRELMRGL